MKILKPSMGWNTWNTFTNQINEELVLETAATLAKRGLKDNGYKYEKYKER